MSILYAILVVSVLGLFLGFGLSVADKKLAVEKDEKLVQLEKITPGANCGGCGFAGCAAYAEAVFLGNAEIGLCPPGGNTLAKLMADIMGKTAEEKMREVAFVHCNGNSEVTKEDFAYQGITDCNAAYLVQGGPISCKEGCLHLGSCIKVCPASAIYRNEKNMILVDPKKCIGCKKCVNVCPNNVIKMIPENADYVVACNNTENGAKVRKSCTVGCIGCKICVTKHPNSGCVVDNFLSHVDYNNPDHSDIEAASAACPPKCFVKR